MSPLLDIQRRWRELGRIRLGEKSAKGAPKKLTEFRLTSPSRDLLDAAATLYGGTVHEWQGAPGEGTQYELSTDVDTIDILVPPGETLSQWYEMWSGGGCKRRCDGQREQIGDQACVCPLDQQERSDLAKESKACKITTRLNVILPRVGDVGVWRLETHGYNAAVELPGTLSILDNATARGIMIPARLRIDQRTSKKDGQTRHFIVPVIELATTIHELTTGEVVDDRAIAPVSAPALPAPEVSNGAPAPRPLAEVPSPGPVGSAGLNWKQECERVNVSTARLLKWCRASFGDRIRGLGDLSPEDQAQAERWLSAQGAAVDNVKAAPPGAQVVEKLDAVVENGGGMETLTGATVPPPALKETEQEVFRRIEAVQFIRNNAKVREGGVPAIRVACAHAQVGVQDWPQDLPLDTLEGLAAQIEALPEMTVDA